MPNFKTTVRLNTTLSALAPIISISVPTFGTSIGVIILFDVSATQAQKDAVNSALTSFDWSDAATTTWLATQDPNRTDLINSAINAVQNNNTYLNLANPTNAQAVAQVTALTQQNNRIIKLLAEMA
jgi:hypothetical protein